MKLYYYIYTLLISLILHIIYVISMYISAHKKVMLEQDTHIHGEVPKR